jgi:hypothetical protein
VVVEDQRTVIEQASDQGRLAVIDRPAGQEAQQILLSSRGERPAVRSHQK